PAFVERTAAFLAQLRGQDVAMLADETSRNFYRLFSKAHPEDDGAEMDSQNGSPMAGQGGGGAQ
ncbi:MAG: hypothetical protein ACKOUM_11335, partial [Sphingopyxis sp.]